MVRLKISLTADILILLPVTFDFLHLLKTSFKSFHLGTLWRDNVTRFGKILPLRQKFTRFWEKITVYYLFGKILSLLWQICDIIGLVLVVVNDKIFKYSRCLIASNKPGR